MSSTIPWKDFTVLSFDIYGTLIDWESGIYNNLTSSPLGPYLPSTRKEVLENFENYERAVQSETPTLKQAQIQERCLQRYAKDLNVVPSKLSEEQVNSAAKAFGDSLGTWPAFPDSVKATKRLGKHYKLVPLSNIDRGSFSQTNAGPLEGLHFDAIYTAEDVGSYKPDPRNFEYLLEHIKTDFGASKEQLCHAAQSLFHDHAPAKKFGLTSVWVDRKGVMGERPADGKEGGQEYGYKLKVESLAELADIVDKAWADGGSGDEVPPEVKGEGQDPAVVVKGSQQDAQ
ncbi:hypothetical protein H2203_001253 [Taxawa tesnikishii (nom. ined.)]|nr:hypothetical protein H2203_001253 [Dothideales sp. JES 119]